MGSDSVFTHYSLRRGPQGDFNPSIWDNGVVWTERSKVQAFQHCIYFWKRRTWTGVILVWTLPFLAHFLMSCCEQRPCLCQILDIKLDAHCPIHAKCASNTISTTGQPGQSWGAGTGAFSTKMCIHTCVCTVNSVFVVLSSVPDWLYVSSRCLDVYGCNG